MTEKNTKALRRSATTKSNGRSTDKKRLQNAKARKPPTKREKPALKPIKPGRPNPSDLERPTPNEPVRIQPPAPRFAQNSAPAREARSAPSPKRDESVSRPSIRDAETKPARVNEVIQQAEMERERQRLRNVPERRRGADRTSIDANRWVHQRSNESRGGGWQTRGHSTLRGR